jgi:hypothetical protein
MASGPPGGISDDSFKSIALEVGDWVWGTVQGAFNEKATLSQIIVDAVIGMIPLVGDVTAVRDLRGAGGRWSALGDSRHRVERRQWCSRLHASADHYLHANPTPSRIRSRQQEREGVTQHALSHSHGP